MIVLHVISFLNSPLMHTSNYGKVMPQTSTNVTKLRIFPKIIPQKYAKNLNSKRMEYITTRMHELWVQRSLGSIMKQILAK